MLLRINDTLINTDHITLIYYNGSVAAPNPEYGSGGRSQSIQIHFVGGKSTDFSGATAVALWERLLTIAQSLD